MKLLLSCMLLFLSADCAFSARILALFPIPARSHHIMMHAVLRTLAQRGHEVVNYTPFPLGYQVANYTEMVLDDMVDLNRAMTKEEFTMLMNTSPIKAFVTFWKQSKEIMDKTFGNKRIKALLQSNEHFDLILMEVFFEQEVLLGFGHKFQASVVNIQPIGTLSLANRVAGNSLSLSYVPDFLLPATDQMSFYERFLSAYSILSTLYLYYSEYLPSQDSFARSIFKDPTMPSVHDMAHNISLFINNAHPNVHYTEPATPNIISIGGIHLTKERKSLPPDMEKFLSEAKHGVIYFSLGSLVPDRLLPQEFFDNFLRVFWRLPQRVLWKTVVELPNLPDNIMTSKWVPQQDVLAHQNVILFMTHGGIFSQHEAINAGVPVVCIPFFGDQKRNAKFYEHKGVGVKLSFDSLTEDTIHSAVTTVLNNPKYTEKMQSLSRIYRDRPLSPADSLVYWIEYVLNHKGAHHLRPASADLLWYQLALLDVAAAVLTALLTVLVALYLLVRTIWRLIKPREETETVPSAKKTDR